MNEPLPTEVYAAIAAVAVAVVALMATPRGYRGTLIKGAFGVAALGAVVAFGRLIEERLLTTLLVVPSVGALSMLFTPRQWPNVIRRLSVGILLIELALSLALLWGDYTTAAYQFVEHDVWVESLGISYKVGVDGISLWLILLTTLLTPVALFASWTGIDTKLKEYALGFLLLQVGMLGAFVALDLFLFYVFWELMLVPMYLIIGVWGGPQRVYAAVKFFIYTMVGSLLMLVAILYVVATYRELTGAYSFDLAEL
jgi:NADH-quinone oxidoreductase subunit M